LVRTLLCCRECARRFRCAARPPHPQLDTRAGGPAGPPLPTVEVTLAAAGGTIHATAAQAPERDDGRAIRSASSRERNRLLAALPADEYARIIGELEPVELTVRQLLWKADAPIRSLYFPRSCVCSLLTPLSGELPVESATIGKEGLAGVSVLLGVPSIPATCVAQVAGEALRVDADRVRAWMGGDGALPGLLLRYAQALHDQTSQSVACNRRHEMEERCARWLLMTHDRVSSDTFALTHEFLASMLGVRRASVTVAAGILQKAGLIRYSRGKITVLDRAALEQASCECYRVVRERYERTVGIEGV
jgi:CRP-like cAMP-binding protein